MKSLDRLAEFLEDSSDEAHSPTKNTKTVLSPRFCWNYPKSGAFLYHYKDCEIYHMPAIYKIEIHDHTKKSVNTLSYKLQRASIKKPAHAHMLIVNDELYLLSIAPLDGKALPVISLYAIEKEFTQISLLKAWSTAQLITFYSNTDTCKCISYCGIDLWHMSLDRNFSAISFQNVIKDPSSTNYKMISYLISGDSTFEPSYSMNEHTTDFRNPFSVALQSYDINLSKSFKPVHYSKDFCIPDTRELLILNNGKIFPIETDNESVSTIHSTNSYMIVIESDIFQYARKEYYVFYFGRNGIVKWPVTYHYTPSILNAMVIVPHSHDKNIKTATDVFTSYSCNVIFKSDLLLEKKDNLKHIYYKSDIVSPFPIICIDKGSYYELETTEPPIDRKWVPIDEKELKDQELDHAVAAKTIIDEEVSIVCSYDLETGTPSTMKFYHECKLDGNLKDVTRKGYLIFENTEHESHYGVIEYDPCNLNIKSYCSYYASKFTRSSTSNDFRFFIDTVITELDFASSTYTYFEMTVFDNISIPLLDYSRFKVAVNPFRGFITMARFHNRNYIVNRNTKFFKIQGKEWTKMSKKLPSERYHCFESIIKNHALVILDVAYEDRPIFVMEKGDSAYEILSTDDAPDCAIIRVFKLVTLKPIMNHSDMLYVFNHGDKYIIEAVTENINKPKLLMRFLEKVCNYNNEMVIVRGAKIHGDGPIHPMVKTGTINIDREWVDYEDNRISIDDIDTKATRDAIALLDTKYGNHENMLVTRESYIKYVFE